MKKKELEQKVIELEKKNQELVDALMRMAIQIQSIPCGLKHYPEIPQIYPTYPQWPYPYTLGSPIWWNQIQCQSAVPNKEYQDYIAGHTYNHLGSGQ